MTNKELQELLKQHPDDFPIKIVSEWLEAHYFESGEIINISQPDENGLILFHII